MCLGKGQKSAKWCGTNDKNLGVDIIKVLEVLLLVINQVNLLHLCFVAEDWHTNGWT